jgi:hypothetical protein
MIDSGDILRYSIVRLTNLWVLSGNVGKWYDEHVGSLHVRLEALSKDELLLGPNLAEEAAKDGFKTLADYRHLRATDLERANRIAQQFAARFSQTLVGVEMALSRSFYPTVIWSSFAVMAVALFEDSLSLLCDYLGKKAGIDLRLNDLRGSSIMERCKIFFQKVLILNHDFETSESWTRLTIHRRVRNFIVHSGGILDDSERAGTVKKYIRQGKTSLVLLQGGAISVPQQYVEELVQDAQIWLEEVKPTMREFEQSRAAVRA